MLTQGIFERSGVIGLVTRCCIVDRFKYESDRRPRHMNGLFDMLKPLLQDGILCTYRARGDNAGHQECGNTLQKQTG